jgi:hypothetical protein
MTTTTKNFELNTDDLLFYEEERGGNNIIMSGGYSVDSYLLKNGLSPMQTFGSLESVQSGGKQSEGKQVSSIFENLAVPAGLFFSNQNPSHDNYGNKTKCMEHKMLPDNIFDEFMKMIEIDKHRKRQRKTRRQGDIPNKRTRKQRDK